MVSKVIKIDRLGDTKAVAIKKSTNNIEETVTKNLTTRTNHTKRGCRTTGTSTVTFKITLETCKTWTEQNWKVWSGNYYLSSWARILPKTLPSCRWCKPFFNKPTINFLKCLHKIRDNPINKKILLFITQHKILDKAQLNTHLRRHSRKTKLGSRNQRWIKAKLARIYVRNTFPNQFSLAWLMASLSAKSASLST